ncbi:MAG: hypothetical protein R3C11_11625 [Planctomycetaceae bacterium]
MTEIALLGSTGSIGTSTLEVLRPATRREAAPLRHECPPELAEAGRTDARIQTSHRRAG